MVPILSENTWPIDGTDIPPSLFSREHIENEHGLLYSLHCISVAAAVVSYNLLWGGKKEGYGFWQGLGSREVKLIGVSCIYAWH